MAAPGGGQTPPRHGAAALAAAEQEFGRLGSHGSFQSSPELSEASPLPGGAFGSQRHISSASLASGAARGFGWPDGGSGTLGAEGAGAPGLGGGSPSLARFSVAGGSTPIAPLRPQDTGGSLQGTSSLGLASAELSHSKSQHSIGSQMLQAEMDMKQNKQQEQLMTGFQTPAWVEVLFDLCGITDLLDRIQKERERRLPGSNYQNPFPELFAMVVSVQFEFMTAFLIIMNCMAIGLEASVEPGTATFAFNFVEHLFVLLFFVEWCLRLVAFGWTWLFELNNFLDTLLVFLTGILMKWVLEPLGVDIGQFRMFTVLRALRLVRLVRSVRLQDTFRELWILIHGLIICVRPLCWVFVIFYVILYVFGVMTTALIGYSDVWEDDEYIQSLFGDLMKSTFTMFQMSTMDTYFFSIVRPVMEKQPHLGPFFIAFVLLTVFVFWNLITAVIVETAFAIAKQDQESLAKEIQREKMDELKMLADIFLEIDKDGSGDLNKYEFFGALDNPKVCNMIQILDLSRRDLQDTWEILDMADQDGKLTIKEFTNGIRRMKGSASAKDIIDVCKQLSSSQERCYHTHQQVYAFASELRVLEQDIDTIAQDTSEVLGLFNEMFLRLQSHIKSCEVADKREADKRRLQRLAASGESAA